VIYFVQSTDGGPIKIGCTVDMDIRLKALERHYGQPLAVLATMPGWWEEERTIHARFAAHRMGRTEQFRPDAEIMEFIGRPLLACPDPDAAEVMTKRVPQPKPWQIAKQRHRVQMSWPCTPEFAEWVREFARSEGEYINDIISKAVEHMARLEGYPVPPPGR
jgi:hypothetical protein